LISIEAFAMASWASRQSMLRAGARWKATMYRQIANRPPPWALFCALALAGAAQAQAVPPPSRGQLLYETHCIECHNTQMHWRTRKQARDWDSLKAQVRRWQATANLGWTEADVTDVARHLNETIYQFPQPHERAGLALPDSAR
jgi:cytochrome c5